MLMNTGRLIRLLRTAEGLSQTRLASELAVSRAYLSQVENGHKQPGLPFLRRAAAFFKIPTALLVPDDNDPDSEIMVELRKMLGEALVAKMAISGKRVEAHESEELEKSKA